jgi:GNAT superfamily N-acetyltransferase
MLILKRLEKLADKQKWIYRFAKEYKGGYAIHEGLFGSHSKFFVAVEDDKELGYIRIGDYSRQFSRHTNDEVWSITEAYVKPAYRSRGYLRDMIEAVVKDHNAKAMLIETQRYKTYRAYYQALGFNTVFLLGNGELARVYLASFAGIAVAANDETYEMVA